MAIHFLPYIPAELRANKSWFIEFKVPDPKTGELVRRCRRVKPMASLAARKRLAELMRVSINEMLAQGWNPLIHGDTVKGLDTLKEVGELYLKHKKDLAGPTVESYRYFLSMIQRFMMEKYSRELRVNEWTRAHAVNYLHWIRHERGNTVRTHNNHLMFFRGLWNWMLKIDRAFDHPFKLIPKEKVRKKRRLVIPEEIRESIGAYFASRNTGMYIACLLIYGTGIRRTELTRLRLRDVDLQNGCIYLSDYMTKSSDDRSPTIPDYLTNVLREYIEEGSSPELFLLGRSWRPDEVALDPDRLTEAWERMRPKLGINLDYQLYSLRDSGIENMFVQGFDAKTVMHQFGHKSLSTTTKYAIRVNPRTMSEIKSSKGGF